MRAARFSLKPTYWKRCGFEPRRIKTPSLATQHERTPPSIQTHVRTWLVFAARSGRMDRTRLGPRRRHRRFRVGKQGLAASAGDRGAPGQRATSEARDRADE